MKRSFTLISAAALSLFALTGTARAEQPIVADEPVQQVPTVVIPRPTFTQLHPLMLRTGGEFFTGKINASTYTRINTSLGLGYEFTPRLLVYLDVRYGTTRLGFVGNVDDSLRVDTMLWSRLDIAAAVGAQGVLMQRGPWRLDLGGEFESSVLSSAPTVERLHVTTPQGRFDVAPYAQTQALYGARWYRTGLMTTLRLRVGPLEPRFGLGFEYIHGTLDVQLRPDSRDTLALLGHDSTIVESPHPIAFTHVIVAPGIDVRLGDRDVIGATGLLMPGYSAVDSFGATIMLKHRF